MLSLNLTPKFSFEPRYRIFISKVCYKNSKHWQSLDSLFHLFLNYVFLVFSEQNILIKLDQVNQIT